LGALVAHSRLHIRGESSAARPRRRHIEEIAPVHQDVRAEEIVTRGQNDRLLERDGDLGLISYHGSLSCGPAGIRIDAVRHRVRYRDPRREATRYEPERSVAAVARGSIDFNIRR